MNELQGLYLKYSHKLKEQIYNKHCEGKLKKKDKLNWHIEVPAWLYAVDSLCVKGEMKQLQTIDINSSLT